VEPRNHENLVLSKNLLTRHPLPTSTRRGKPACETHPLSCQWRPPGPEPV